MWCGTSQTLGREDKMPRSHWKLNIDASNDSNASIVMNKCIKLLVRPPVQSNIQKYSKGGYMAKLEFYHDDKLNWPEIVYEIICFGEKLGSGWVLLGDIEREPIGMLSKNINAKIKVQGLHWAEWQVTNESKA